MVPEGNTDYAATRVQARHGRRMDTAAWRRLDGSRDLAQYLDAVRASALAIWVTAVDASQDCHTIERTLRNEWRHYVDAVAQWHPPQSQAWLSWCAWLPTLSLLATLAHAEVVPHWMLTDPICGPVAPGSPTERAAALTRTPLAPLEPALLGRVPMGTMWRIHWQQLMPQSDPHTKELLQRFLKTIDLHAARLQEDTESAVALRSELAGRLAPLFRAGAGTVVATACHLALLALDLERLRGGLVNRCVFGAPASEHS